MRRNLGAFWLLGLINNSAYVIMIAGANQISAGSIGLVYLAAVLPSLAVKLSAPYWFHTVAYAPRMVAIAGLMVTSYWTVALSATQHWQLIGVSIGAAQAGLGEATCLAMAALYEPQSLVLWSSGTGFAGVFGYGWVTVLHLWLAVSFRSTLLAATMMVAGWLAVYFVMLKPPSYRQVPPEQHPDRSGFDMSVINERQGLRDVSNNADVSRSSSPTVERRIGITDTGAAPEPISASIDLPGKDRLADKVGSMGWRRRLSVTLSLWPYTVPLGAVYAAEYSLQSGVWTAIGFPVTDPMARSRFYSYSNWCYQAGVFISRSSPLVLPQATRGVLWLMPLLQCLLLAGFLFISMFHWPLYNMSLLIPAVAVGLLGGAVYVGAFSLIAAEVDPSLREFALGAASVADSLGIALADVIGIVIQGCVFRVNGLPGADFKCWSPPQ